MNPDDLYIVFVTVPDADTAERLTRQAVESGKAACASILPGLMSIFRWQGAIETAAELLLVMKTSKQRYPELEELILDLHPYDTPEVVALAASAVSQTYLQWAITETSLQ